MKILKRDVGLMFLRDMPLWQKILLGMVLGFLAGLVLGPKSMVLKPLGTLFIHAIKMLIVPLIFCSLVVGVTSMSDIQKMGRVGLKALLIYLSTTAIAISVGLSLATVIAPGAGLQMLAPEVTTEAKEAPAFIDTLLNVVPTNPVQAFASGNVLQIIVFALALGSALTITGDKAKPAITVFESLAETMYTLTNMVMKLAPIGVFGLMAWVVGKYGLDILLPLFKVIGVVYLGCLLLVLVFYTGLVKFIAQLKPVHYLKALINPAVVGYTTSSSSGTLPVTIKTAQEELGVSKGISSFVLPLGATINMDGTAMYQGVAALFIAQAYGIDLGFSQYLAIIATSTLASIGSAGVPGAGLIMLSLVLTTVGLPLEGLAIIAGVDRILDMARTTVNICGDLMVSILVSKSEGELDEGKFNSTRLVTKETLV